MLPLSVVGRRSQVLHRDLPHIHKVHHHLLGVIRLLRQPRQNLRQRQLPLLLAGFRTAQRRQTGPRCRILRQVPDRNAAQIPQHVPEVRLHGPHPLVVGPQHRRDRVRCRPLRPTVVEDHREDRRQRPQKARLALRVRLPDARLVLPDLQRRAGVGMRLVLQQRVHETRLSALELHPEQFVAAAVAQLLIHEAAVDRLRKRTGHRTRRPRRQMGAQHRAGPHLIGHDAREDGVVGVGQLEHASCHGPLHETAAGPRTRHDSS